MAGQDPFLESSQLPAMRQLQEMLDQGKTWEAALSEPKKSWEEAIKAASTKDKKAIITRVEVLEQRVAELLPLKEDVQVLKRQVEALEQRIAQLES